MPVVTFHNINSVKCGQSGYLECRIAYWIWMIVPIVVVLFGVVGNIFSIAVLSRKSLRKNSTCIILIFLAGSDTTVLLSSPLSSIIEKASEMDVQSLSSLSCGIWEWVQLSAGFISCWFIVLITAERTLLTLFPIKAKLKKTPRNAFIASTSVIIFCLLFNGHSVYGYVKYDMKSNLTTDYGTENGTERSDATYCVLRPGWYTNFHNDVMSVVMAMCGVVLPIGFIVTGNAIVGISIIRRKRAVRDVQQGSQSSGKGFSMRIFFVLCAVYVITTLPFGFSTIFINYDVEVDEHTLARYQLLNAITKSLAYCNFSFNFILYFMTGTLFREEFKQITRDMRKLCHAHEI